QWTAYKHLRNRAIYSFVAFFARPFLFRRINGSAGPETASSRHRCPDDPFDRDLSTGFRSRNTVIDGNLFYNITPQLQFGLEVSHWRTQYLGLSDGKVVRVEPARTMGGRITLGRGVLWWKFCTEKARKWAYKSRPSCLL